MDIPVSTQRPETLTQAYHAGIIISMIENYLPNEKLPPIVRCLINFYALRELLGERLWFKLKASSKFSQRIKLYEDLTYQPSLPKSMIGTYRDFFLGYVRSYEKSKLKQNIDKDRQLTADLIYTYLTKYK